MMARDTDSDSDEDIWVYTSCSQTRPVGKTKGKLGARTSRMSQKSSNIAQCRKPTTPAVGKGKGSSKSNQARGVSRAPTRRRKSREAPGTEKSGKTNGARSGTKGKSGSISRASGGSQVAQSRMTSSQPGGKRKAPSSSAGRDKKRAKLSDSQPTTPRHSQSSMAPPSTPTTPRPAPVSGHCPHCQMPFSLLRLHFESPDGHSTQCMDTPLIATLECKAGVRCDSTLPNHYRKYTHTVLANRRAGLDAPAPPKEAANFSPVQCSHIKKLNFGNVAQKSSPSTSRISPPSTVSAPTSPYFNKARVGTSQSVRLTAPQVTLKSTSKKQLAFTSNKVAYSQCLAASPADSTTSSLSSSLSALISTPPPQPVDDDDGLGTDEDMFLDSPEPTCVIANVKTSNTPWETVDSVDGSDMVVAELLGDSQTERGTVPVVIQPIEECRVSAFVEPPKDEPRDECIPESTVYIDRDVSMNMSEDMTDSERMADSMVEPSLMEPSPQPSYLVLATNQDSSQESQTQEASQSSELESEPNGEPNRESDYATGKVGGAGNTECMPESHKSYCECPNVEEDWELPDLVEPDVDKSATACSGDGDNHVDALFTGSTVSSGIEEDIMLCPDPVLLAGGTESSDSDDDMLCPEPVQFAGGMKTSGSGDIVLCPKQVPSSSAVASSQTPLKHTTRSLSTSVKQEAAGTGAKFGTKQTSIQRFFTSTCVKAEKQDVVPLAQSVMKVMPPHYRRSTLVSEQARNARTTDPGLTTASRGGAARGASTGWGGKKPCPFYKKIPGTGFTVDAFNYGVVPGCKAYILTHFHYDHYEGLTRKFIRPIYCSKITGNLVVSRLKVNACYINTIPLDTPRVIEGVELTFMEANHCPGSVIILFKLIDGRTYLHTGDFRACREMEQYPALQSVRIDQLYLDTTYCDAQYAFPPQREVVAYAVGKAEEFLQEFPNALIVVGSYTIGKERIFMAIAEALGARVCVKREKLKVLECLEDAALTARLTLNKHEARVHVLLMAQLRYEILSEYLSKLKPRYDRLLAFQPTGWTHTGGARQTPLDKLRPKVKRDKVTIYGIPYSEHSSYTEMRRFCQVMRPTTILATVNNGNPASRAKMEKLFALWMSEGLESPTRELKQRHLKGWVM